VKVILIVTGLVLLGAFFCVMITPELLDVETNAHSESTFTHQGAGSLTNKIMNWLPIEQRATLGLNDASEPDWSRDFWSPIDIEVDADPMITMCKLNFREYSQNPHLYPMFRDLESLSRCTGVNRRKAKLSLLMSELRERAGTPEGHIVPPTAFIFHESRVGSTLVANSLASDPFSMVFSESPPPANSLLHCTHCTKERQLEIIRFVVLEMYGLAEALLLLYPCREQQRMSPHNFSPYPFIHISIFSMQRRGDTHGKQPGTRAIVPQTAKHHQHEDGAHARGFS
jgi:hypothetical protein